MAKHPYNLLPDTIDNRDHIFSRMALPTKAPSSVDLRPKMPRVVNQLELGSCTSNAIGSGLMEYVQLKNGQALVPLSRLYHYYKEREVIGTINEDSGAMIRDGMKLAVSMGICPEPIWPYIISQFTIKPPAEADTAAPSHKLTSYQRITTLTDIKRSLIEGYPVVMGMPIFESFESTLVASTGNVPMPKRGEQNLGGHAVLIVGYKDTTTGMLNKLTNYITGVTNGIVIVRNSWGTGWGDKGYFYLPYQYIAKYVTDLWTGR